MDFKRVIVVIVVTVIESQAARNQFETQNSLPVLSLNSPAREYYSENSTNDIIHRQDSGCSASLRVTEVSTFGAILDPPTDPPPSDCKSYRASNEFQPWESYNYERTFFRGGTDLDGQNLYPCKVNISGRVFLGRGKVNEGRCWFPYEDTTELSVNAQVAFLRRPSNVRLIWRNTRSETLGGIYNAVYAQHPDQDEGRSLIVARTSYQVPSDSECNIDYHTPEAIIPGVIEMTNASARSAKFRFTFGTRVYTANEFQVLTCEDSKV